MFQLRSQFLIVLVDGKFREIEEIFANLWIIQVFNVGVLFQDENGIVLQTFRPFNKHNFMDTTPIIINEFINGSFVSKKFDIDFINLLSSTLNFRIIYTFIGPVGYLIENGTAKGPLRALLDNKADISV